jgi:Domain of unknown function (DUF4331)
MSNHFSAADLKSPGDDARLDLTDLFVFTAPDNPGTTVLIMDSNPFTKGDGFHPGAVYRFNIDNDGDAVADVAFSFTFSPLTDGRQTATAYYATGSDAQTREPRGERLIQDTPAWTPPPRPSRPARSGCSPASAATPSSPTPTASCTGWSTAPPGTSSGPARTPSPAPTSSPSRWKYPTTCSAPDRSEYG